MQFSSSTTLHSFLELFISQLGIRIPDHMIFYQLPRKAIMSISNAMFGLLTLDNYENWKVWMKSYLVGQSLWDIVEGEESEDDLTHEAWREKNGRALHAIQNSCGSHMFSCIKELGSAKEAWNRLAVEYKSSWGRRRTIMDDRSSRWQDMRKGEEGYKDLSKYRPLYVAAFNGDWKTAKSFFDAHPDARAAKIDKWSSTALHIAAHLGNTYFVEEMVKNMSEEDLTRQNDVGSTAFHLVTEGGNKRMAKVMLDKNYNLLKIRDGNCMTPLLSAALFNNKDVLLYLYSQTTIEDLKSNSSDSALLLRSFITTDSFDLALDLLRCCPECATTEVRGQIALKVLAGRPSAFKSRSRLGFWQRLIYSCVHVKLRDVVHHVDGQRKYHVISIEQAEMPNVEQIDAVGYAEGWMEDHYLISTDQAETPSGFLHVLHHVNRLLWGILQQIVRVIKQVRKKKLMHMQASELVKRLFEEVLNSNNDYVVEELLGPPLIAAAELGIVEFLTVALQYYPRLIEYPDENIRSILQIAVTNRQDKIFNILNKRGRQTTVRTFDKDIYLNNILHLAGKIAPPHRLNSVSGAALQMQRELQWFKEVEKIAPPTYKEWKNSQGLTPQMLFTEEHQVLLAEGEKWMKDTAASCSVAGALIITIMFAAAFTVPGGFKSDTGVPLFLNTTPFTIFVISDALALFTASTSMLMFLSILTSRYAENDFLLSLPKKVILGLSMLYISVAAMMAAFSATIFIVLSHHLIIVSILLTLLGAVPVMLFVFVHFPLFVDVVRSTYGSGIFY